MTHALSLRDVSVLLNTRRAVDGVSLDLASGGLITLVGPNGAGKSTLLKTLAGLIRPQAGTIALDGRRIDAMDGAERARKFAYVPQERLIAWPLPGRAVVALGRAPYSLGRAGESAADRRAIDASMTAMDVAQFAERSILELSGGERARVLMARALAQEPVVLLADEPAAGLDPAHQWALFEHLAKRAANGRLVLAALHDLALAAQFSTHVVLMDRGRIAAHGRAETILTPERLAEVYGIAAELRRIEGRSVLLQSGLAAPRRS